MAVGTELLLGDIVNTNAQFISQELAKIGVNVYRHSVVGDNAARLKAAFAQAFEQADCVIATGGLGPTDDDITRETAAEFFGLPLVLHEESWQNIQNIFNRSGNRIPDNNIRQATLPKGCLVFHNRNGTAPGLCIEQNGKTLILLPGPPNELVPMFLEHAVPFLRSKSDTLFVSKTLKLTGVGESRAAEILKDMIDGQTNPTIAPYAKISEVWLRVTASAPDEAQAHALIASVSEEIYRRLGAFIYGEDEDSLESVVVALLKQKGWSLACAESCTGGLLTGTLVNVPGVSDILPEAFVTYSNEAKTARLGVSEEILRQHGAVSAEAAAAMAEGVMCASSASVGLSVTGIAGPDGGTPDKPVGLVYLGLAIEGQKTQTKELFLSGNRAKIRQRAVISALDFLRVNLK